jgi:hypothetical protein
MTPQLSAVESAYPAEPTSTTALHEQLQQLVAPILTDKNRVILSATNSLSHTANAELTKSPRRRHRL